MSLIEHTLKETYNVVTGKTVSKSICECNICACTVTISSALLHNATCPICKDKKPPRKYIVYYFKYLVSGNDYVWKLGYTVNSIDTRYLNCETAAISDIRTWEFNSRKEAMRCEQSLLHYYNMYKYKGKPVFKNTGIHEVFYKDIYEKENKLWPNSL